MLSTGAIFSPCKLYRYVLWRCWGNGDRFVNFIGLNPSIADETQDDPTIRRCIGYAKQWGYDGLRMTNIFGFRATDPKDMMSVPDPTGEENIKYLIDVASNSELVVAAWGGGGLYLERGAYVKSIIPRLSYLRFSKKTGQPWHPLYLPKTLLPIEWL